ncbi:MAG: response regulator [Candidatus Omnitrophica bacterium]|nr:response regulator [Candidatus Omnitrophota bacterium]
MPSVQILLIEDLAEDAQLIREALAAEPGAGFQLTHADRLVSGLRHLDAHAVDLVLLDLKLPDSEGLETLVAVREHAPHVPIVVLTASDDTALAVEAVQKGAADYLVKGYVQVYPALLGRAIRYALERRRAEAERSRLQRQLSQAQKMETVGRFAGGIAHDFKNVLQVILSLAWLIRSRRPNDPELLASVEEIVHAAESGSGMVQQLLTFSRQQPLEPKPLDLNEAVRGMARLLQQLVGEPIRLQLDLQPGPLLVRMDPTGLEQILMNLCANARDSMPQGGPLTIRTARRSADEAFADAHPGVKPGEYVGLSIQDRGSGMDPAIASHIFEPFFTTKHLGQGTGLGLAVVYGLVQQHEGCIEVDTAPGRGTTFHLYLPFGN